MLLSLWIASDCINKIEHWMGCNKLRLNVDKTQVIWMGTRQQLEKIEIDELILHSSTIQFQRRWSTWASSSTISWRCPNKSRVVHVSSSCVKFGQSGGPWRRIQQRHSWMPSLTYVQSPRLLQLIVVWLRQRLDGPAAACAECCGTARIWRQEIRPHHTDNDGFALVADSTASDIQGGHPGLQMSPWLRSRQGSYGHGKVMENDWSWKSHGKVMENYWSWKSHGIQ